MDKASFCTAITKCKDYDLTRVKKAIARLFALLGLSSENPLQAYVCPGDTVVLKPNWISEKHAREPQEWQSVITHPAVITTVLECVLLALKGKGRVIIADAPQTDSSFSKILELVNAEQWEKMGADSGVPVQILDLRDDEWISKGGLVVARRKLPGDPKGSVTVDLADKSTFSNKPVPPLGYYGADYKSNETTWAHSQGRNLYKVSRSVIEADVFINLPKLKTHKKAGITVCMKNLVGINTYKNYLPHHCVGSPAQGGDQFPSNSLKTMLEGKILSKFQGFWARYPGITKFSIPAKALGLKIFGKSNKVVRTGSWYGNDTLWRTIVDLNQILLYANSDGMMRAAGYTKAKRCFFVVDGIVAGEGLGPASPERVDAGVLIAGANPLTVDCTAARIMGFDYRKIHYLREAFNVQEFPIADLDFEQIKVNSDWEPWNKSLSQISLNSVFRFKPSPGWVSHIEMQETG